MTEYIKAYLTYIQGFIDNKLETASDEEIEKVLSEFETKIEYFQHERLIHLIVTMFFALFTLSQVAMLFLAKEFYLFIAALCMGFIFLMILIAYVCHYYFLENSVQKMYRLRDQIVRKRAK